MSMHIKNLLDRLCMCEIKIMVVENSLQLLHEGRPRGCDNLQYKPNRMRHV